MRRLPVTRSSVFRARSTERGFGLLEVALALVVLSIGILGLASLMPAGTRSAAQSGDITRASELSSQLAEKLLAIPYSNAALSAGAHLDTPYPAAGRYYLSYTVEDDQPIANCKRITVTTHWPQSNSPNPVKLVIVNPRANDQ
jgi:prepilin-type N-terminal cleavage/methylation domain-containing protein